MLELKKVKKVYKTGDFTQYALKGVSLNFRESEFASILGPSGSGKTTLLNIIGGLDNYSSGNLIINEVSTKNFRDKDWDSYRNHRIGFVFQSYNLIPHQTILKNVTLALTISGISKSEATKRAKKALEEVGLKDHIQKRPAQLSGGQMQRVAIARALVNDPDILLADEPTGALDSETSIQIMDILKRIAKEKLVIMVTHNPELAEAYSTRIITLKDGNITSDTNPYDGKINTAHSVDTEKTKQKKTKMSFFTSMALSFNNLLTKKARTLLIAIAGSIGIIGIALILAVSNGFQRYIDGIEQETMTSYPLGIMAETSDMTSLLLSLTTSTSDSSPSTGADVKESQLVGNLLGSLSKNDLPTFKHFLEENPDLYAKDIKRITYNYSIDPLIYTRYEGSVKKLNPSDLFTSIYGSSALSSYSALTSIFSSLSTENPDELKEKYNILEGRLPEKHNELLLVLPSDHRIPDFLLYSLGFRNPDELTEMITGIMSGNPVEKTNAPLEFSYSDLMKADLHLIHPKDLYSYNAEYNIYEDRSADTDFMNNLYNSSETLHIVGIATPDNSSGLSLSTAGIFYRNDLITHIVDTARESDIVKAQLANESVDVFSGKNFGEKSDSLGLDFKDFISIDEYQLTSAFGFDFDPSAITAYSDAYVDQLEQGLKDKLTTTIDDAKLALTEALGNICQDFIDYLPEIIPIEDIDNLIENYLKTKYPEETIKKLLEEYPLSYDTFLNLTRNFLRCYLNTLVDVVKSIYEKLPSYDPSNPALFDKDKLIAIIKDCDIIEYVKTLIAENTACLKAIAETAVSMLEAKFRTTIKTEFNTMTTYMTSAIMSHFHVDPTAMANAFQLSMTEDEITRIVTAMFTNKSATYSSNLISLGYQDPDSPTSISIYFSGFDGKTHFLDLIEDYNNSHDEAEKIKYTDTAGILTGSVKTIVDAVTYVLIAFVSISLVVSSIMIGVITYISVYERTKEIGILRALGASKRNVSSIFSAETFIIGFLSGLIAMIFTFIAIPIINSILVSLTGIEDLTAYLSIGNALSLILLSVILTIIGGFIPSRSASRKDPVEALRTE